MPKLTPPAWVEFGKFGTWDYGRYRDSHERTHYVSESYMNEPGTVSDLVKSMKSDYDYAVDYQAKETADWASEAAKIKASNAQAAREIDADMANFMRNKTTEWNRAADTLNNIVATGNSNSHHSRDDAAQLNKNERDKTDDIYPDKKANTPLARRDDSGSNNRANETDSPKSKEIEWGPIKLEAIAICNQSAKNSKWQCYGPVQNEPFHDGASLESSLAGQRCAGGTWAAGGPILEGVQWQAYRCGHSLGFGDYDVAQRYSLITARRSYICRKDQTGDGRCSTIYDGQDKR